MNNPNATIASGWNTWDVYYLNGVVHLPSLLRLRFGILNTQTNEHFGQFTPYQGMQRLGPHAADGSYSQISLQWDGMTLECEYASRDDHLICRVQSKGAPHQYITWQVDRGFLNGTRPIEINKENSLFSFNAHERDWIMHLLTSADFSITGDDARLFTLPAGEELVISLAPVNLGLHVDREQALEIIQECRDAYQQRALTSDGWLTASAASGLTSAIHWNTIYEPMKGRVCTPVSRNWCMNGWFGDYVLFVWDSFFCALMESLEEPVLAIANFAAMMQEMNPRGFLPNFGSGLGDSNDRSFVPVGAYTLLKLYRSGEINQSGENPYRQLLMDSFDDLLRWHEWWIPHRDGNNDGLLEYGSDPVPSVDPRWEYHNRQAAKFESGLDNSPMYDDVPFNTATNTLELADVGLNALYALDAWALAQLSRELDHHDLAETLEREYEQIKDRINAELWNEEKGIYQNKHWDGRFSSSLAPTLFYPMLAGIASPEQAERMVKEHLLNEDEFWGHWVIPSIARNDPTYKEQNYWRGRIWPPFNFLVCEGLRRYGYDDAAYQLSLKSLNLFLGEWDGESHSHENYNAETGDGDDRAWNSDPTYHWGSLLAYLAMQELVDFEVWNGWRFGTLSQEVASLRNIYTPEGLLDVSVDNGLTVTLDNHLLLQANTLCIVRGYIRSSHQVRCVLSKTVAQSVTLKFGKLQPDTTYTIMIDDVQTSINTDEHGVLSVQCAAGNRVKITLDQDVAS